MPTSCPSLPVCCEDPFAYAIPGTPWPPLPGYTPVVTSEEINVPTGLPLSYQIIGTNHPDTYGASGLPAGLYINGATGAISGTITDPDLLTYLIAITATNEYGTGTGTLTINVVQDIPVLPNQTIYANPTAAVNYQIIATNSPFSYGAVGLPVGLSLNTATGLITGHVPNSITTTAVPISATNLAGTGFGTLTIVVKNSVSVRFRQAHQNGVGLMPSFLAVSVDGAAPIGVVPALDYLGNPLSPVPPNSTYIAFESFVTTGILNAHSFPPGNPPNGAYQQYDMTVNVGAITVASGSSVTGTFTGSAADEIFLAPDFVNSFLPTLHVTAASPVNAVLSTDTVLPNGSVLIAIHEGLPTIGGGTASLSTNITLNFR